MNRDATQLHFLRQQQQQQQRAPQPFQISHPVVLDRLVMMYHRRTRYLKH